MPTASHQGRQKRCPSCILRDTNSRTVLIDERKLAEEQLAKYAELIQINRNNLRRTEAERDKAMHDCHRIEAELQKIRSGEGASTQGNSQALTDAIVQINILEDANRLRDLQLAQTEQQHATARAEIERMKKRAEKKWDSGRNWYVKCKVNCPAARDSRFAKSTAADESYRPAKRPRSAWNNDSVFEEGSDDSPLLSTLISSIEAFRA